MLHWTAGCFETMSAALSLDVPSLLALAVPTSWVQTRLLCMRCLISVSGGRARSEASTLRMGLWLADATWGATARTQFRSIKGAEHATGKHERCVHAEGHYGTRLKSKKIERDRRHTSSWQCCAATAAALVEAYSSNER
jgi:hypothetical protein